MPKMLELGTTVNIFQKLLAKFRRPSAPQYSNFWVNDDGTIETMWGADFPSALEEAQQIAAARAKAGRTNDGAIVVFVFNDVTVNVAPDSNLALISRDWNRARSGYIPKTIGPHPAAELSEDELAHDAEQARPRTRHDAEQRAHRERVEARMASAPAMEFSDENAWLEAVVVNGGNPFGDGILAYTERWARMMQLELSEGKTLEEVWDSTAHEADLEGLLSASQFIATHLLTISWVHGAELRRLHNAFWGSDATDRTVNPAIVYIETGE